MKNLSAAQEIWVRSLRQEDILEKGMATHFSVLAWRSPWAVSLVGYSPWGCRVGHNWATTTKLLWSFISFLWWCHVSLNLVIFVAFVVCAFKKVVASSSLYSLASEGKALHQSACPEILSKASGGVHGCLLLEFSDRQVVLGSAGDHTGCLDPQGKSLQWTTLASEFTGVDQVPESVMVSLGPESVWVGLDPGSVPASQVLGTIGMGLASGSTWAVLVVGQAWSLGSQEPGSWVYLAFGWTWQLGL